jgi:hypothetical protein
VNFTPSASSAEIKNEGRALYLCPLYMFSWLVVRATFLVLRMVDADKRRICQIISWVQSSMATQNVHLNIDFDA